MSETSSLFDGFTLYLAIGLFAGLAGFMLLFTKFDLPGYCKRKYKLYTRLKAIGFALVIGIVLAFLIALILDLIGVNETLAQILEGVAIGFNCAMLVGIVRPAEPKGNYGAQDGTKKKQYQENKGRRSKG